MLMTAESVAYARKKIKYKKIVEFRSPTDLKKYFHFVH